MRFSLPGGDFVILWAVLVIAGLWFRPLTPVDETRAASVAWEMRQRGGFLVPHLNGETYSHKPPLLQWGMHLTWRIGGVHDWTTRLPGHPAPRRVMAGCPVAGRRGIAN